MIADIKHFIKKNLRKPTRVEVATGIVIGCVLWQVWQNAKQRAEVEKARIRASEARRRERELQRAKAEIEAGIKADRDAQKKREDEAARSARAKHLADEKAAYEKILAQEKLNKEKAEVQARFDNSLKHITHEGVMVERLTETGAMPRMDAQRFLAGTRLATVGLPEDECLLRKVESSVAKVIVKRRTISRICPQRLVTFAEKYLRKSKKEEKRKAERKLSNAINEHNLVIKNFREIARRALSASRAEAAEKARIDAELNILRKNAEETRKENERVASIEANRLAKLNASSPGLKRIDPSKVSKPVKKDQHLPELPIVKKPFLKSDPQPVADSKVKANVPFNPRIKSNIPYVLDVGVKDSFATPEQLETAFPEYYKSAGTTFLGLGGTVRNPTERNYPRYFAVHDGMVMPTSFAVRKVFDAASQIRGLPIDGKALSIQLIHPLWMAHPRVRALKSYSTGMEKVNGRTFHWIGFPYVKEDQAWEFNLMVKAPPGYMGKVTERKGELFVPYVQTTAPIPTEFWVVPCKAFYTWNGGLLFFLADNFLKPRGIQLRDKVNLSMTASLNLNPKGLEPKKPVIEVPHQRQALPHQDSKDLDRKIEGSKLKKVLAKRAERPKKLNVTSLSSIMNEQSSEVASSQNHSTSPESTDNTSVVDDDIKEMEKISIPILEPSRLNKQSDFLTIGMEEDFLPLEEEVPDQDWSNEFVLPGTCPSNDGYPPTSKCDPEELQPLDWEEKQNLQDSQWEDSTTSESENPLKYKLGNPPPSRGDKPKKKLSTYQRQERAFLNTRWQTQVVRLLESNPSMAIANALLINTSRKNIGLKPSVVPKLPIRIPKPEDYDQSTALDFAGIKTEN